MIDDDKTTDGGEMLCCQSLISKAFVRNYISYEKMKQKQNMGNELNNRTVTSYHVKGETECT